MAERISSEMKGKPGYEGYLNDRVVSFQEVMRDGGRRIPGICVHHSSHFV